jgi:hypothetical protein
VEYPGDGVVLEVARQERAVLVVGDLLVAGLADALRDAAVDLSLDERRGDPLAAVVDGDVALDVEFARVGVDRDDRRVRAERVKAVPSGS